MTHFFHHNHAHHRGIWHWVDIVLAILIFLIIVMVPGRAFPFEVVTPATDASLVAPLALTPPPVVDGCLPLLDRPTHDGLAYATDRYHRAPDESVAIAVVLGVRFAFGAPDRDRTGRRIQASGPGMGVWSVRDDGVANNQALAIAEYRRCRTQQSLREERGGWR